MKRNGGKKKKEEEEDAGAQQKRTWFDVLTVSEKEKKIRKREKSRHPERGMR